MANRKWVYDFAEGSRDMRELLGGKGANVAEMTRVLGAERVPAGFTITTEACVAYMRARPQRARRASAEQVAEALERLEERAGKRLGDPEDPLLVSVRSGARESMPGMLDTVLNLGLNDESVEGLAARPSNERFAWDSYRRFVQMFGNVCRGVPGERFEDAIRRASRRAASSTTPSSTSDALRSSTDRFKELYASRRRGLPAGPAGAAAAGDPRGVRLLDGRARGRPTGASTTSPTTGAPRSTSSRWCSATRATRSAPASRSPATRSPARPSRRGDFLRQRPGRGRRLRRAHAARHLPSWAR